MTDADGGRKSHRRSIVANPAIALGTNMTAGMLFFSGIGYYFDSRQGRDAGVWTLVGMFLGLAWCGYEIWKLVRGTKRDADDRRQQSSD